MANPLVIDPTIVLVDRLFTAASLQKSDAKARATFLPVTLEITDQFGQEPVDPEATGPVLKECISRITVKLREEAARYSSIRWLWMLRRLPGRVFAGHLLTTGGYDSALAEVISGQAVVGRATEPASTIYDLGRNVAHHLSLFCAGVRLLSHFHASYRIAGKGGRVVFRGGLPKAILDPDLQRAIETYDARAEQSLTVGFSRIGSVLWPSAKLRTGHVLLGVTSLSKKTEVPCPLPGMPLALGVGSMCRVEARFGLAATDIKRLEDFASAHNNGIELLFSRETAALVFLGAAAMWLVPVHGGGLASLFQTGYLLWTDQLRIKRLLEMAYPLVSPFVRRLMESQGLQSGLEAYEVLAGIEGGDWPLAAGPILRSDGTSACLDLLAASRRLETSLQAPRIQGVAANQRAAHFEDQVQELIRATRWNPSKEVLAFRRRTLRRNGRRLTDIDAIGCHRDSVLLVSCKGTVYDDRYDIGDHRAVRNVADTVAKAIENWQLVAADLRANPQGDNYDFRSFHNFVAVVCTPKVVFLKSPVLDLFVAPGLRAAVDTRELSEWLRSKRPTSKGHKSGH